MRSTAPSSTHPPTHSPTIPAALDIHRGDFDDLIPRDPDLTYKVMRSVVRTVHKILRRMNFQYAQLTDYISRQHGRY